MKEVSLKILFSVSLHSQFALGAPSSHQLLRCLLSTRTDSTLAATLRVSIHRFNPWVCLSFQQTASASCFPHHSVPQYAFAILRSPCCLCTVSTLFTPCVVCFTLSLHSASTLTWYIPNTNSYALRWFLPHRFVRIVHLLRKRYTFSGS